MLFPPEIQSKDTTIITLADWYHYSTRALYVLLSRRYYMPNTEWQHLSARADSTLINGLGRSTATPNAALSVINVFPGKRYRFRLISLSCDPNFVFSIDGHNMTVIEADAVNTQPLPVDSIQIFAGQRYSFVLEANQPTDNYWIRANPDSGTLGFDGGLNSAILRYVGAVPVEPTTNATASVKPLKEAELRPLVPMPVVSPYSM